MSNGWNRSADAWIADMGEHGDFSRQFVLDPPMIARVRESGADAVLDVGCGEGRFCRMMRAEGLNVTGIDPTPALLREAQARGEEIYVEGEAEDLPFEDGAFDLVVSYMTLIDMDDIEAAFDEMVRVLRPGGRLLIANLSSFATAIPAGAEGKGWMRCNGEAMGCDDYHRTRAYWIGWRGIRVRNWHRPLQEYMSALLSRGLQLSHFQEPAPVGGPPIMARKYGRAPMFVLMEWAKPG